MPCPKCGGILAREDGVVFCENPMCFHVVERRGDPKFDKPKEKAVKAEIEPTPKPKRKKLGRPKRLGRPRKHHKRREPKYKKQPAKGRICSAEWCNEPVLAKGLCKRCYGRQWDRNKKSVKPSAYRERYFVFRFCTIFACTKKHFAGGYCKKHYSTHVARYPKYSRPADPNERKCNLCPRLHYAKGLCKIHYNKLYDFNKKWKHLNDNISSNI